MMARMGAALLMLAPAAAQDLSTSREMLFSSPGAELPDVYLSESVIFLDECAGASCTNKKTYTVVLTHPPGMREDETIDLDNDEVRIYLTSSQEHFQQDDNTKGEVVFEQRRNHRTQLIIETPQGESDTTSLYGSTQTLAWGSSYDADPDKRGKILSNLISGSSAGKVGLPLGPLPYIYKTFSTVGGNIPEQQSPTSTAADGSITVTHKIGRASCRERV